MNKRTPPVWAKSLLLLLGVAGAMAGVHLLTGNHLALLDTHRDPLGMGLFILLGAAACAFGLPRQLVASAAAASFGLWGGVAVALAAQFIGCTADFFWARFIGRAWTQRRIKGRLVQADEFFTARPVSTTLMLRLFPVGNNLAVNLLAGVSNVSAVPFFAGSLLGYVPQTLIFALAGTGRSMHLWIGLELFVLSTMLGLWLAKRHRARRAGVIRGSD
jgi:uncharacterized membrane protein YdjX (TVP38/TMEM64 family)